MEQTIYWLTGALGVPLITWLKQVWNIKGKSAMGLTAIVSALLGITALFIAQEIALTDFTLQNIAPAIGQVLAAATLAYKLLRGEG